MEAKKTKKSWYNLFGKKDIFAKLDIEQKRAPTLPLPLKAEEMEIIRYRKVPDSEMLAKMKLKMGENKAKFVLEVGPSLIE